MKNIDKMTKKELASQITRAKMKDANQSLMDKHNKAQLQTMLKKELKKGTTVAKPKAKKAPAKKKTVRKPATKRTLKKR